MSLELINRHLQTVSTGGYLLDRYTAITSGGSSGQRGVFVYDWEGWAVYWLSAFRYLLAFETASPYSRRLEQPSRGSWPAPLVAV